jgi:hypothetical protein
MFVFMVLGLIAAGYDVRPPDFTRFGSPRRACGLSILSGLRAGLGWADTGMSRK